jgi:DNA-binding XRE family transcriptional regulator
MAMKNPPHPGCLVLRQCIEPLGLTIKDAAAALGVTRTTLSELVNGKRGKLAYAAGALRCCPSSRRPDQTKAAPIRLSDRGRLS